MMRQLVGVLLGILVLASANLYAAERIALVIGNGKYEHIGALKNPPKDVQLISVALEEVGFDVTTLIDAGEEQMIDALHAFSDKIDAAGQDTIGLFYFAGHGINYAGNNWLVPVDARVRRGPDIEREAVSAHFVLRMMEDQKNLTNIIVLDACRDNPFKDVAMSSTRSLRSGMAAMKAPRGSFIAFSTAEGDVAYDGRGDYSPFAEAFAGEITTPDITINSMMIRVNAKVDELTQNLGSTEQVPWARYSLKEDFYFNKRAASPQPAAGLAATPTMQQAAPPRGKTREERESDLWNDIKDSRDPDEFAVFLKQYPDGAYAELARIRQEKFNKPAPAQSATEVATQAGGGGQQTAAERGIDPDIAAFCREFAAGDSSAFADCIAEMNEDDEAFFATETPDYPAGGYPEAGVDPTMMGDQPMSTTTTWYDNEYNQWQVIIIGDEFAASSFLPGSGPISLQGRSQGNGVSYGIFDGNGLQVGYGQGTFSDATHINVTSYWSNGAILGSTTFHVNHPPQ